MARPVSESAPFITFRGITKAFAGVVALSDVSFSIARGECHGLMGENGAGKSTLGKVLAGIHRPDAGDVLIEGQTVRLASPADANDAGIGMVHQELAFCPELSVAENLSLGMYPRKLGLFLDRAEMSKRARALIAQIGVTMDVEQPMRQLSTAQEQLVQIASAVGTGARILVFDEPTSSLSEVDAQNLFTLIEALKARGVTMVYVSHRMPELFRLCDRISVLRDGKYVGTVDRAEATQDRIVQMMIGRSVEAYFPHEGRGRKLGEPVLRVRGLTSPGKFHDVSFEVRAGEIVGMAGLVGAGRSEVAKAIFGLDPRATGEVFIATRRLPLGNISAAKKAGVGLVPEDRKRQGLVLGMSCLDNFSHGMLDLLRRALVFVRHGKTRELAQAQFARLRVKTPSLETPAVALSGGNQQKIVLAKWLARDSRVLIVDEPTRGVDVGAKAAIHQILDELAQQGVAVLLISSELPEVINLPHRVLVMREGSIVGELPAEAATQDAVLRLMTGVTELPVSTTAA